MLLGSRKKNWRDQIKILPVGNCFPILDPAGNLFAGGILQLYEIGAEIFTQNQNRIIVSTIAAAINAHLEEVFRFWTKISRNPV